MRAGTMTALLFVLAWSYAQAGQGQELLSEISHKIWENNVSYYIVKGGDNYQRVFSVYVTESGLLFMQESDFCDISLSFQDHADLLEKAILKYGLQEKVKKLKEVRYFFSISRMSGEQGGLTQSSKEQLRALNDSLTWGVGMKSARNCCDLQGAIREFEKAGLLEPLNQVLRKYGNRQINFDYKKIWLESKGYISGKNVVESDWLPGEKIKKAYFPSEIDVYFPVEEVR